MKRSKKSNVCKVCKGKKLVANDEPTPSAPLIKCPHCEGTGEEPVKPQRSSPFEDEGLGNRR